MLDLIVELAPTAAAAGCEWWDGPCVIGDFVGGVAETIANAPLQGVADSFMNGWAQLEMYFLASWIAMPLLVDITAPEGTTMWLQQILGSLTFAFAVLGGLITAGWTFLRLRTDKVKILGGRLMILLLVSTSGAVIIAAADIGIRALSLGILSLVGITPEGAIAATVLGGAAMAISPGVMLIIGIAAIIGVLIQWVIMIMRGPLVVLLVGLWPFAASAATLGVQKAEAAFDQITAWLIAFVIYPFPAALVYAAAFRLKGGADGFGGIMYGLVLELLAVMLMPALLRIIAPHTKAVGEKWGGKVAVDAAVSAAETAVTVGAAVVTAGAFGGAFAAKAGAAGAKAGADAGAASAAGNGGPSTGADGGSSARAGADATGAENGAAPASRSGADTFSSDQGTPPSGAQTTEAAASTTAPRDTTPPHDPPAGKAGAPPAPVAPKPKGAGGGNAEESRRSARVHAATQAAQAASHAAGRSARQAVDDIDDIIGGKQ
ncbi:hypothetical protein [Microbacterium sp. NPDC055665]